MLRRVYTPAPPLSAFVQDFWLYDDYTPRHGKERIVPSGTIELVINLRDDELRIYDRVRPGVCERFSGAIVSGAYGRFFVIDTAEERSMIGVHFKPGGAFPFLGLPAGEVADAHVDLETLWGRPAVELRERLSAVTAPSDRFRELETALVDRLLRSPEQHGAVAVALDSFALPGGSGMVRDVTRQVGLSQRRFIEIFKTEVGLTPKLFHRVHRFQRVLGALRHAALPDWARLAADHGFFDQSHLIRDFHAFTGLSPGAYVDHQRRLERRGVHLKRNHLPLRDEIAAGAEGQFFPIPALPRARRMGVHLSSREEREHGHR